MHILHSEGDKEKIPNAHACLYTNSNFMQVFRAYT